MPGLYKFLHSRDLPKVLDDETIRICSASYFRQEYEAMEVGNRDPTINDPLEGSVYQVQGIGGSGPGQERLLAMMGINVGPDSPLYYGVGCSGNVLIERTKDFHMFCLADHALEELIPNFCTFNPSRPGAPVYDACLELLDDQALGALLVSPNTKILNLQGSGYDIPLSFLFPRIALRPVQYQRNIVGFAEVAPRASPIVKRIELEWQHEVRFVFDPAEPEDIARCKAFTGFPGASPDPAMIVRVPGIAALMRQIDIRPYL